MINALSSYIDIWEAELNIDIMTKSADEDLVNYIADAWESIKVVKQIEFLGYDFETAESKIDINNHIFRRTKKVAKKDKFKLKMIDDTRCGLFTAHLKITLDEIDPKSGTSIKREKIIHKDMLVPLMDDDGMYFINGRKYYIIYQLTEKSTYNTASSNILKSLMPLVVKRESVDKEDITGTMYKIPVYNTFVYKRENPVMLYMFANEGVDATLMDLRVHDVIKLVPEPTEDAENLYFPISAKCYVEVIAELFQKYSYVRSVVGGLLTILTNRFDMSMTNNNEPFIKKLTSSNTIEKGMDNLTSFNRMMDKTTRKILKVNEAQKHDVYATLRWVMFEFDELRMKDNMDLKNKRLRCSEYVASLLTQEFSSKLNRVINLGAKVTMDQICDIFKFPGDMLLQKMHVSGILRFDETINDMTFFSKLKWTLKGPHSIGGKNENNIMTKYRGCHPSFLGNLDLLTCGNSDPGTSGILSPFCDMKSFYFDKKGEPDEFIFEFMKDVKKIMNKRGVDVITIEFDTPEEYYTVVNHAREFNEHDISIYGVSKDATEIQFIREKDLVAEHLREDEDSSESLAEEALEE